MKTKIIVIAMVIILVFSLGCIGTGPDEAPAGGEVTDVNASTATAEVDSTLDDLSTDLNDLDSLIIDSGIDIEDTGIDESLI